MDASLIALAERNPSFRVVLRGNSDSRRRYGVCDESDERNALQWFAESYLPLVLSKDLVRFEQVPIEENRFWKNGVLQTLPVPQPEP